MENSNIGFSVYKYFNPRTELKRKRYRKDRLHRKKEHLKTCILTQQEFNVLATLSVVCLFLVWFNVSTLKVQAASMSGVGDIFNSETFIGNTKWLEKMNFMGRWTQILITVGCTFASMIIACQIILTLVYFGMPQLWDGVNQAKVVDGKKGLWNYTAGLFTGGKSGMVGNLSRGSDIFLDFLVLMLPNVKKYSENAEDDYENFTTWFMSTALRKCLILTALSMAINGSLMKAYMVVVDGFGAAAQRFVEIDGAAFVNNALSVGDNYQFSLGASGQGFDELQGTVAKSIYKEVMKSSKMQDADSKYTAGASIEKYVRSNITKDEIMTKLIGPGASEGTLSEEDWGRVKVQVVLNGTSGTTNGLSISASDLGLANLDNGKPRYIHIYFTLKSRGDTTYYFGLPEKDD